jgi:hypothetical protein
MWDAVNKVDLPSVSEETLLSFFCFVQSNQLIHQERKKERECPSFFQSIGKGVGGSGEKMLFRRSLFPSV